MKRIYLVTLIFLFVLGSLSGPALAKDTQNQGKPFQELWNAIENIQLTPGPQGEQGKLGPQGEQGKLGPQGDQGKLGPQGDQGVQGKKGDQGEQGKEGPQGIPGESCQVSKNCFDDGSIHIAIMECPNGDIVEWPAGKCGDGYLDDDCEACDDGNLDDGDGCRDDCTSEICGDGFLDPGEECDDGNTDDLDGCNASCEDEGTCQATGEYCTSNADCPAVPGTCPYYDLRSCWQPSDCYKGWCTTSNNRCSNDTNCAGHVPGSCVRVCVPNPNDCIF